MGLKELPRVVSLVGAGGKTTVMYALARRLAGEGKRVLVMTTTHIYEPSADCFAPTAAAARRLWESGGFAVIGEKSPKPGKLTKPDAALLEALSREADHILVEADGSKHYPIKVPREQEPVILAETDLVIAVMGLSAIGQPLEQCCFGMDAAKKMLNQDENHLLTEKDAASLLLAENGGRKNLLGRHFWVILNQCDDEARRESGRQIAEILKQSGIEKVILAGFDPMKRKILDQLARASDNEA